MKYKNRTLLCIVTALFLIFGINLHAEPVFAVSGKSDIFVPEAVTDATSGIVEIVLSCVDESGKIYYLHQGSGFLVGGSSDSYCVITDQRLVTAGSDELLQIRKWAGLDTDASLTPQVYILLQPDIAISATITSTGTDYPYALLTPATALNDASLPRLQTISNVRKDSAAYLAGYNLDISILGQETVSPASLDFFAGQITSVQQEPLFISCNIDAKNGCAGSPLFDENGYVLGMFYQTEDGNLDILPSDTIMEVLQALNIPYLTSDPSSEYNIADPQIIDELTALLHTCQEDVTNNSASYSKKTLSAYKTAINDAMKVLNSRDATKDDYQNSIDALNSARQKLKPANFTARIAEFVLLGILIVLVFFHTRQLLKAKRLKNALHPAASNFSAYLKRLDTGETISLKKGELRIGKDAAPVDYCIKDHPAVSRYHAAIVYRSDQYYVIDNNSTNHTYLNQAPLSPQRAVALHDQDTLKFADVSLQFFSLS